MRCKAFTLAEILVTLGIIGIVAALTIPSIITSYQKKVTVTNLKSVYSVLNQAYKSSVAENGEQESWIPVGDISAEEYFNKYLKPYIKILKMCDTHRDCGYKTVTPWIMIMGHNLKQVLGKIMTNG